MKSTHENRLSVGKDANGAWIQTSSCETAFVLATKDNYQVVYRDAKGRFYYNERIGRKHAQCSVQAKDVFTLKRFAILLIPFTYILNHFF